MLTVNDKISLKYNMQIDIYSLVLKLILTMSFMLVDC